MYACLEQLECISSYFSPSGRSAPGQELSQGWDGAWHTRGFVRYDALSCAQAPSLPCSYAHALWQSSCD